MNLTHEGLSLWYGTPDAPAPIDEVAPRSGPSLVVGVRPANPTNAVLVRYRVERGPVQAAPGRELRTDYDRDAQYFAVRSPAFPTGDAIEYSPMLTCGGRQVPPPHAANRFPLKFRLAAREAGPPVRRAGASTPPQQQRFAAGLGFVATVAVQFSETQFVGETAAGMRVNFFVGEGTVQGRGFKGNVTPGSARPDADRRMAWASSASAQPLPPRTARCSTSSPVGTSTSEPMATAIRNPTSGTGTGKKKNRH